MTLAAEQQQQPTHFKGITSCSCFTQKWHFETKWYHDQCDENHWSCTSAGRSGWIPWYLSMALSWQNQRQACSREQCSALDPLMRMGRNPFRKNSMSPVCLFPMVITVSCFLWFTSALFSWILIDAEESHAMEHGHFGDQHRQHRYCIDSKVVGVVFSIETGKEKSANRQESKKTNILTPANCQQEGMCDADHARTVSAASGRLTKQWAPQQGTFWKQKSEHHCPVVPKPLSSELCPGPRSQMVCLFLCGE